MGIYGILTIISLCTTRVLAQKFSSCTLLGTFTTTGCEGGNDGGLTVVAVVGAM